MTAKGDHAFVTGRIQLAHDFSAAFDHRRDVGGMHTGVSIGVHGAEFEKTEFSAI